MTTRRGFLRLLSGCTFGAFGIIHAAQDDARVRIGYLRFGNQAGGQRYLDAFVQAFREFGYAEPKNLALDLRFADGKAERLSEFASELVNLKVRIMLVGDTPSALAAKRATTTIPIVFATITDPVGSGLVASLAHPGGNITGFSNMSEDISPKHVELLRAIVPKLSLVAVLTNPGNPAHRLILNSVEAACDRAGIRTLPLAADTPARIDNAFAVMSENRAGGVIVAPDTFFSGQKSQIAANALKYRIPAVSNIPDYVDAEIPFLLAYGQDPAEHYRRAAAYCDKILKGARPSDLPVEQSETLHLAVSLKAARALGVAIPQSILVRADMVFD
jgi:putative ABC transport system substrate-binding protein